MATTELSLDFAVCRSSYVTILSDGEDVFQKGQLDEDIACE